MKSSVLLKRIIQICFILILSFLYISKFAFANETIPSKRVLFLSSYHYNFLSVPKQIQGISDVLTPHGIEFDVEYMDNRRFYTKDYKEKFYDIIKYKLDASGDYDGVIVADDDGLQFVLDYYDELFCNVPITYLCINDLERANKASTYDNITGVVEETAVGDNIKLAMNLLPNADRIVAIVDNTYSGIGNKKQFYSYKNQFPELKFSHLNVSEYTFKELESIISSYGDNTILMYYSMYQDKDGNLLTIEKASELLVKNSNIPIFRSEIGGVGKGILGGKMVSYYDSGKIAANMMLDIFNGRDVKEIPQVASTPHVNIFDYDVIEKYRLSLKVFPKDSVFLNKELTYYEKNEELLNNIFLLFVFLFFVFCFLLMDNMKRRKLQKELIESHEELTQTFEELTASEEERTKQYEALVEHSYKMDILNQKYAIAIESTESAVWEYELGTQKMRLSKNFIKEFNLGIKEEDNIFHIFHTLFDEETKDSILEEFHKYISGKIEEIHMRVPITDMNKKERWILIRGRGVKENNASFHTVHGIILEVTKMKKQEEHIEYLAEHDYITGLPNRYAFIQCLEYEIKKENVGAVMILDIDNFKSINDTQGHVCGDKMLFEIAKRFRTIKVKGYEVFRFGGDEFLMVLKGMDNIQDIEATLECILALFEEPITIDNSEHYVKFSIGISRYPYDHNEVEQLLMNIDTAMYHVKRNGRNHYMFYHEHMNDELLQRANVEMILAEAVRDNGFKLVYQPQVDVYTGEIVSFEGLLRLKSHNISPAIFIDIAEDNGMIRRIGRWVAEEAILQLSRWKKEGKNLKPIAINFSSKQLIDNEFVDILKCLLDTHQVEAKYLEIEITESVLFEKTELTMQFLNELRAIGIKLALDDFGTGFSSLNYITYIPVHKIKLDRSLCERFLSLDDNTVMDCLIRLIHSLGLVVTAEGIETKEQFFKLFESNCDYIQGYLFSRPLDVKDIDTLYDINMVDHCVLPSDLFS